MKPNELNLVEVEGVAVDVIGSVDPERLSEFVRQQVQKAKDSKLLNRFRNEPTWGQKAAGNYKKTRVSYQGIPVTIETRKGEFRVGVDEDGNEAWRTLMPCDYGYIRGTDGQDGEQLDVFVGDSPQSKLVFVIEQHRAATFEFDELKAMLGFRSMSEALMAYFQSFSDHLGRERLGEVVPMPIKVFKAWLRGGKQRGQLTNRYAHRVQA